MRIHGRGPENWAQGLEFLSTKIGAMAIVLGTMHFGLMFALQSYANAAAKKNNNLTTYVQTGHNPG